MPGGCVPCAECGSRAGAADGCGSGGTCGFETASDAVVAALAGGADPCGGAGDSGVGCNTDAFEPERFAVGGDGEDGTRTGAGDRTRRGDTAGEDAAGGKGSAKSAGERDDSASGIGAKRGADCTGCYRDQWSGQRAGCAAGGSRSARADGRGGQREQAAARRRPLGCRWLLPLEAKSKGSSAESDCKRRAGQCGARRKDAGEQQKAGAECSARVGSERCAGTAGADGGDSDGRGERRGCANSNRGTDGECAD